MSKSEETKKRAARGGEFISPECAGVQGGCDAAPPLLNEEQKAAFDRGVAEFNTGYYFECHDTLESMLRRALKRFARYPDRYFGFDLAAHREELQAWLDRIVSGRGDGLTVADLPKWTFGPPEPG